VPRWYWLLVGGLAAQRLLELAVSRRRQAQVSSGRTAGGSFPLMVTAHAALLTLPLVEVAFLRRRPRRPAVWAGVLGGAALLRRWSIRTLGPSWNVRAVVPSDLSPVTDGPYRWIRHPNYLAVIVEFLALPMACGAWLSALLLSAWNGLVLFDRIRSEERLLSSTPGYDEAFAGKARFIPGIF
jgi:methyltransferase